VTPIDEKPPHKSDRMIIWNSENEKPYPIQEDDFAVPLDDDNGALIVANYDATGAHYTVLLFYGPKANENAAQWDKWTNEDNLSEHDEERVSINTDTKDAIASCFG
jgi:hypothetical protein